MTNAFPHPDYPVEASPHEVRAGFEVLILYRLVDPDFSDLWTPVVGKILGSSDVVVKCSNFSGGYMYSHQRFGNMVSPFLHKGRAALPEWLPVGSPYGTFEQAILEAEIGASETDGPEVIPTPAEIRRP